MRYKIITDSACSLTNMDYQNIEGIQFEVAPLTIHIQGKEFVDDGSIDNKEMLALLKEKDAVSSTSCPSPHEYLKRLVGADKYIIITLTSKLSGSFNSANTAKMISKDKDNVIVIDSKAALGSEELLVKKAIELIQSNTPFEKMESLLNKAVSETNLLFSISNFESLVKSGRINKIIAFLATKLKIKPLGIAKNGIIELKEKCRTNKGLMRSYLNEITKMSKHDQNTYCIISETENSTMAEALKNLIQENFSQMKIVIKKNLGLCSYYAREGSLIVAF